MAVDIRGIEKALIKTIRQFIGSKLSTYGTGTNAKPSVIRSRLFSQGNEKTTPTFPDYPYVSVDYTRLSDEGYELSERFYDENDNYVYRTHKIASYSIRFFGTSEDDVMSLCNEMHMLLEVDGVREMIHNLSPTEARVRSKTDPVFVASVMEDKYREVASFDLILSVIDEVVVLAADAPPIENVVIDTTVPQEGIQGGIYDTDPNNPSSHVKVETKVTYP